MASFNAGFALSSSGNKSEWHREHHSDTFDIWEKQFRETLRSVDDPKLRADLLKICSDVSHFDAVRCTLDYLVGVEVRPSRARPHHARAHSLRFTISWSGSKRTGILDTASIRSSSWYPAAAAT